MCPTIVRSHISIHAPRAGSDCNGCGWNIPPRNFNPRSPCGERLACRVPFISPPSVFQSTLPVRGATKLPNAYVTADKFQSTLPVRGATTWTGEGQLAYQIFQSTLPVRGATMTIPPSPWLPTAFQSTLPVRGATAAMVLLIRSTHRFQSTLPVRGATRQLARRPDLGGNFNPRSPCGERQMFSPAPCGASGYFNPRSPCGERRKAYRTV